MDNQKVKSGPKTNSRLKGCDSLDRGYGGDMSFHRFFYRIIVHTVGLLK